jgi:geranylgeranyl transferase type-1 subunit beta
MTYSAILSLLILGDDLSRLDKEGILKYLKICQQADGSFAPHMGSKECDMRFVFCAFAICFLLKDWSSIEIPKSLEFIKHSQSYDGGFGTGPKRESHGGSTYCAVAALALVGQISLIDQSLLLTWLMNRQDHGFNGRINKPDDTCYGYWIGCCIEVRGLILTDIIDNGMQGSS